MSRSVTACATYPRPEQDDDWKTEDKGQTARHGFVERRQAAEDHPAMLIRLIPIVAIAALVLLIASGAFGDASNAGDTFIVDGVISEVDGVLDDALDADSFDWLNDSLTGAAGAIEDGVEDITN